VLRSREDAEDATQEAILRAWLARGRCEAAERPAPWIGQIARNEALRLGAQLATRKSAEVCALGLGCEPVVNDRRSDGASQRSIVVDTLRNLPPRDIELVTLRYIEDLQYSAIAERLGLPLGTVKIRLHRLHVQLRKACEV
jgi:RNA polymerase sigma-70 factor (ECF subfamily)